MPYAMDTHPGALTVGEPFADRTEAGRLLAQRLAQMNWQRPVVVLALPRGGVPVAAPIARALAAPLELLLVRKIGVPWQPELAVAAVVESTPPAVVVDERMLRYAGLDRSFVDAQVPQQLLEIERRRALYRHGRAPMTLRGCSAIVVDDGIATGTTLRAALKALRRQHPARLVLAVPVAPPDVVLALRPEVDDIVCLRQPWPFEAIGDHYVDFHPVEDGEVLAVLGSVAARPA